MALHPDRVSSAFDAPPQTGAQQIFAWGLAALLAAAAAALAGWPDDGPRPAPALAAPSQPAEAATAVAPAAPAAPDSEVETAVRRLEDRIAALTQAGDAVLKRLDALEGRLADVTGSVRRQDHRVAALEAAPEPPPALRTTATLIAEPAPSARAVAVPSMPATPPADGAPRPMVLAVPYVREAISLPPAVWRLHHGETEAAAEAPRGATQFGIDLGGAATLDGLRTLWSDLRKSHGPALQGLRPVIGIVENSRARTSEFRLIAGPLVNATAAGRLCAQLAAAGRGDCQATIYEGQRLASR